MAMRKLSVLWTTSGQHVAYHCPLHGNDRVSAFSTCGQFLKCFGKRELYTPDGIAVDNNTGNIYVCDDRNDCIFVY